MNMTKYVKMNVSELEKEITMQRKKIETAKEIIALLQKLELAENVKHQNEKSQKSLLEEGRI